MWPESDATLIFATKLISRNEVAIDGLQHHLVSGGPLLGQVDPGVPSLSYQLDKIVLSVNVHLKLVYHRVATKNLRRFSERLIKESIIKGEG